MGHPEHHLLDAERARVLDQRVEQRDERLAALEREALRGGVAELEKLLEPLRLDQAVENAEPLRGLEIRAVRHRLHPVLQPGALLRVLDVHVLDADRPAVRCLQPGDQVTDGRARAAPEAAARDDAIEVRLAEAELRGLEERVRARRRVERIQPGDEVSELAVGVHEVEHADDRRDLARGSDGGAVRPVRELVAGEEERPFGADGRRIDLPAAILLRDVLLVRERRTLDRPHPDWF